MSAELPPSQESIVTSWMQLAERPGDATFILDTIHGGEPSLGEDPITRIHRLTIKQKLMGKSPEQLQAVEDFVQSYLHRKPEEDYSRSNFGLSGKKDS